MLLPTAAVALFECRISTVVLACPGNMEMVTLLYPRNYTSVRSSSFPAAEPARYPAENPWMSCRHPDELRGPLDRIERFVVLPPAEYQISLLQANVPFHGQPSVACPAAATRSVREHANPIASHTPLQPIESLQLWEKPDPGDFGIAPASVSGYSCSCEIKNPPESSIPQRRY